MHWLFQQIKSYKETSSTSSKLQLRKDRPSAVVIYDGQMGTVPGSHYHKTCCNRSCNLTQFYGYTTTGCDLDVHYDPNWQSLPFFFSRETVFSVQLLDN